METKKELKDILEEIEQEFDKHINTQLKIMSELEDDVYRYGYGKSLEAYQQGKLFVKDIIRKHMDDGWIPVEERFPEYGKKVLAYGKSGEIDIASLYSRDKHMWLVGSMCSVAFDIIAWRTLPEPYRPERSDNHDGM